MKRKLAYLSIVLSAVIGGLLFVNCYAATNAERSALQRFLAFNSNYTLIDGEPTQMRWDEKPEQLLSHSYPEAKDWFTKAREESINADTFWTAVMQRAAPHWLGTDWDYNGTTRTPGEGAIACGYLLTTMLEDVGFDLPRAKLAQLPSEAMIRRLVTKPNIRHYLNMSHETFIERFKKWGTGVYIIGMDNHTGFLWNDGKELYFIHSSWWPRNNTMKEIALWSPALASTQYRVVGKLSADSQLFAAWKQGKKVGYKKM